MLLRFLVKLTLAAVLAGCGGGGDGVGSFYINTDVTIVDLDNNGLPDIVVLAAYQTGFDKREGHLVIYRQSAPGIFDQPVTYVVGSYPWQLSVEDIDGDGAKDVAIADVDDNLVYLLYQDPANLGLFLAAVELPGSVGGYSVALADLNNDGQVDIAGADTVTDQIVIHYQDPAAIGTFQISYYQLPVGAQYLATGDLNADGLTDILSGASIDSLAYILQEPGGQLGQAVFFAPLPENNLRELAIADYDGDNHNDILAGYSPCCSGVSPITRVLLQYSTAPGTFMPPVDTPLLSEVFNELDGDNLPDAANVEITKFQCAVGGGNCSVESEVDLLLQSGGGTFYIAQNYSVSLAVDEITAGDLDLDGANDLVLYGTDVNGGVGLLVAAMYQSTTTPGTFGTPVLISQ